MTVDPYARTTHDGKPIDNATHYALLEAERRLGYRLTVFQGIGGAAASAGTHTEGRAVDLSSYDQARKVRVLRDVGFAAWFRPESSEWPDHIHAVLIFESADNQRGIAGSAFRQIGSYLRGRDGLSGDRQDPNPYRPNPRALYTAAEFREDTMPEPTFVQKVRTSLVEAQGALGDAIQYAKQAEGREVVQSKIPSWRELRKAITDDLDGMPKK